MYKIIGADQKEYGPITGDQIRQWIAEGRVNAHTRARAEGAVEWQPLSAFAEFAGALGVPSTPPPFSGGAPAGAPASAEDILGRDYNLDIGGCLKRSWELVKNNFWPVIGVSLLIMVINGVINQLIGLFSRSALNDMILNHRFSPRGILIVLIVSILSTPVYTVLIAGLLKYYLKLIRHENPTLGDAFSGFGPSIGQLVLLGLAQGFLTMIGFVLCVIPGIYLAVSWYFALPLLIDRQLSFWEAMELSRKVIAKHWFIAFGFMLVMGLVSVAGVIACCIGLFVTVPIALVALMYAYEDIFSNRAT
jgi:uncharacterized membrane protein